MNYFTLSKIAALLLFLPTITKSVSLDSLKNSYYGLPDTLKSFSLLDGAIATETRLMKNLYNSIPNEEINKAAINLIRKIFYSIPQSNQLTLSIKYDHSKLITVLINNLVYQYLKSEIRKISKFQIKGLSDEFLSIGSNTNISFKKASPEVARLAALSALWYTKSHIHDFPYKKLLQKALIKACEKLLPDHPLAETKKKYLPTIIEERIRKIKDAAEKISLDTKPDFDTKTKDFDYETAVITKLKLLRGHNQHPEIINRITTVNIKTPEGDIIEVTDCNENLIRNLFNLLAYDPKTKTISGEYLQARFPNIDQRILQFYKDFPNFSIDPQEPSKKTQKDPEAFARWATLMTGIPGVKYNQASPSATRKNYNLDGSLTNLIIIFNHFLNTNWFELLDEYPQQENPFLDKHIATFTQLFGTNQTNFFNSNNMSICLINYHDQHPFQISFFHGHGEISFINSVSDNNTELIKQLEVYPMLWYLVSYNEPHPTNIPLSILPILAHPITSPSSFTQLFENLPFILGSWINPLENLIQKNLTLNNTKEKDETKYQLYFNFLDKFNKLPKIIQNKDATLTAVQKIFVIARNNNYPLENNNLIKPEKANTLYQKALKVAIEKATKVAIKEMTNNNPLIRARALKTFKDIVLQNKDFIKEASNAAIKGLSNADVGVQKEAIELLIELVKRKLATTEAINAISKNLNNTASEISPYIPLLEVLVKNLDPIYSARVLSVLQKLAIEYPYHRETALNLFNIIVKEGDGYNETIETIKILNQDINLDSNNQKTILEILLQLLENSNKNDGKDLYTLAIDIASKAFFSTDKNIQQLAAQLFIEIFNKTNTYENAWEIALQGIKNANIMTQQAAIDLINKLIQQGAKPKNIVVLSKQWAQEESVQTKALELLRLTIEKKLANKEEMQQIEIDLKNLLFNNTITSKEIQNLGLKIFSELSKVNHKIDEAVPFLEKIVSMFSSKTHSLSILNLLIRMAENQPETKQYVLKTLNSIHSNTKYSFMIRAFANEARNSIEQGKQFEL